MEIEQFGKDHWSTFAYAECCAVDDGGKLSLSRLRINKLKRPIKGYPYYSGPPWKTEWGTRVKDGSIPDPSHDDIDCLDDLEASGLLEWIGTLVNPVIRLTDKGKTVAAQLRQHKANGGQFATFEIAQCV